MPEALTLEVLLSHWKPRTLLLRLALPLVLLGSASTGIVLMSLPAAASALPNPGATSCSGSLTAQPNAALLEPYNEGYSFYCTNEITAYSIIVDRVNDDGSTVDNYNNGPAVIDNTGQPSSSTSVACGGDTPSNGIDCYSEVGAAAGPIGPGWTVQGSIDLTDSYCAYLPKGAKAGTPRVPRAIVELVVTDNSGATDGPFELFPTKACKAVPAVVPAPKKPAVTKKTTKPVKSKTTASARTAAAKKD
jgi:hypothetical protein